MTKHPPRAPRYPVSRETWERYEARKAAWYAAKRWEDACKRVLAMRAAWKHAALSSDD